MQRLEDSHLAAALLPRLRWSKLQLAPREGSTLGGLQVAPSTEPLELSRALLCDISGTALQRALRVCSIEEDAQSAWPSWRRQPLKQHGFIAFHLAPRGGSALSGSLPERAQMRRPTESSELIYDLRCFSAGPALKRALEDCGVAEELARCGALDVDRVFELFANATPATLCMRKLAGVSFAKRLMRIDP